MHRFVILSIWLGVAGLLCLAAYGGYFLVQAAHQATYKNVLFPVSTQDPISAYLLDSQGVGYATLGRRLVIAPVFAEAFFFDPGGLARVKYKGKWGFIDRTGNFVINPIFEELSDFDDLGHALARVDEDPNLWGVIDRQGQWVHAPSLDQAPKFPPPGGFPVSYGPVPKQTPDGVCYLDEMDRPAITPCFAFGGPFYSNGLASVVTKTGQRLYIDKKGEVIFDASPTPDMERSDDPAARADWRPARAP